MVMLFPLMSVCLSFVLMVPAGVVSLEWVLNQEERMSV